MKELKQLSYFQEASMQRFHSIILVDDDPINNLINRRLISKLKLTPQIEEFLEAEQAIERIRKIDNEKSILIFLDINMPVMNGWDFLNEIEPFVAKQNTIIFLLTSSLNKQDMDKATQFSLIEKYLSKPISKEMLTEIKEKFID